MSEATREDFEEFLRATLPEVIRPRWEIRSLVDKAKFRHGQYPYYKWDAADLYRQMGELLLQSKDEDFLNDCA